MTRFLGRSPLAPAALSLLAAVTVPGAGATAQQPVTREQAIAAALARGGRLAAAHADSLAAEADVSVARALPNPSASAGYTKSVPRIHAALDLPVDFPWVRAPRIAAAEAGATSAAYRFAFARAAVSFEADTTYTLALASAAHQRLSRASARDADSLLGMARIRRDAGDASELDVQLAAINAGQLTNAAAGDSLAAVTALLELQRVMGLPADRVRITLADSLDLPSLDRSASASSAGAAGAAGADASRRESERDSVALTVAAAEADVRAAEGNLALQRHSVFGPPSLQVGFETEDPTGGETGILPTVGVVLPLPVWTRNRGEISRAAAGLDRARAQLDLARRENEAALGRARRERDVALSRAARDRQLVESAERVVTMTVTAYAEGAVALPNVLEAQRSARDLLGRFIDDLASARKAIAGVRLFGSSVAP